MIYKSFPIDHHMVQDKINKVSANKQLGSRPIENGWDFKLDVEKQTVAIFLQPVCNLFVDICNIFDAYLQPFYCL